MFVHSLETFFSSRFPYDFQRFLLLVITPCTLPSTMPSDFLLLLTLSVSLYLFQPLYYWILFHFPWYPPLASDLLWVFQMKDTCLKIQIQHPQVEVNKQLLSFWIWMTLFRSVISCSTLLSVIFMIPFSIMSYSNRILFRKFFLVLISLSIFSTLTLMSYSEDQPLGWDP